MALDEQTNQALSGPQIAGLPMRGYIPPSLPPMQDGLEEGGS